MMHIPWSITIAAVSVIALACSLYQTKEAAYLDSFKGRGTQTEVRQALGEPQAVRQTDGGNTVWVYERRAQQAGNRYTSPGVWCEQYLLTFDEKGLLQGWKPQSHFHGGELMPTECIPAMESQT